MARIRTVKPSFFRHEKLQDLESANPGKYVMLVFAGLWGHCDKNGVFEWKPRTLKLDILPFIDFPIEETLSILVAAKLVSIGEAMGKQWGSIESFTEHQRISGKELQEDSKFPSPSEISTTCESEAIVKQQGSNGEAVGTAGREGKGTGKEGKGNKRGQAAHCPSDVSEQVWADYLSVRKVKKAAYTETAIDQLRASAEGGGYSLEDALKLCCKNGWVGFDPSWIKDGGGKFGKTSQGIALLEQMKG